MITKSVDDVNRVINDNLRSSLKELEDALNKTNEDIIEYMQLEKTLEFTKEHKPNGFKTKVDVGSNCFMTAKVDHVEPILINIGLDVYLELQLDEALKFIKMKVKALTREGDVIREESLKIRTQIKILLMYLAEREGFATQTNE